MSTESLQELFPRKTTRFDVPAAGEPKPALKYRLFPPRFARKVGNAAPLYRKAFEMAKELEENDGDRLNAMELIGRSEESKKEWWGEGHIPEPLPPEEEVRFFEDHTELFAILDEAAVCGECDWELSTDDLSWYVNDSKKRDLLLPSRTVAILLVIRTRYALEQNNLTLAVASTRTVFSFAENILKMPMVSNAMIAAIINGYGLACVQYLITSGKLPNLYWSLAQLPRFSHGLLRAVESERNYFFASYPQLREAGNTDRDADHGYWQEFGKKFLVDIQGHLNSVLEMEAELFEEIKAEMEECEEDSLPLEVAIEKLRQEHLESAAEDYKGDPARYEEYKKKLYPAVPQTILDELPAIKQIVLDWGCPVERVERLCAEHLIAIYAVRVYEELYDEITKWFAAGFATYVHFFEGVGGEKIEQRINSHGTKLARLIADTLGTVGHHSIVGVDEETDALRIVEAIRLYAALHNGKLPKKLDKITEVPIPHSSFTGKQFRYKVEKTKEGPIGVLKFTTNIFQEHRYEIRIVGS